MTHFGNWCKIYTHTIVLIYFHILFWKNFLSPSIMEDKDSSQLPGEHPRTYLQKFKANLKSNLMLYLTLVGVIVGFAIGFIIRTFVPEPSEDFLMWLGMYYDLLFKSYLLF